MIIELKIGSGFPYSLLDRVRGVELREKCFAVYGAALELLQARKVHLSCQ